MSTKKILVAFLIIVVAIAGFVAGLYLLRKTQKVSEEAAVPGGQAKVKILPETGEYQVGDTIEAGIYFNTANISINGVVVRLSYPYSGTTPEVSVSSITVNSALLSTGDWTCPTQTSSQLGGNVVIDIACANTSASGFSSPTDVLLANISLKIEKAPSVSPLVVRFDPAESKITRKSNNEDILLIPEAVGSYTIAGAGTQVTVTASPTPTERVTATATPTIRLTPTPTSAAGESPTPTPTQLPEAGVSLPTLMGVGLGIIVIVAAFALAL